MVLNNFLYKLGLQDLYGDDTLKNY